MPRQVKNFEGRSERRSTLFHGTLYKNMAFEAPTSSCAVPCCLWEHGLFSSSLFKASMYLQTLNAEKALGLFNVYAFLSYCDRYLPSHCKPPNRFISSKEIWYGNASQDSSLVSCGLVIGVHRPFCIPCAES